MNNMLRAYGENSIYGADTPIAIAGIVSKIQVIYIALIIGLINGSQPICSYNYGAEKYGRVRKTLKLLFLSEVVVAVLFWLLFQLFPQAIISLFGDGGGDPLYLEYGIRFMRGYFMLLFIAFVQPVCGTFFPAIGKAAKGAILSFSRSIVFLIPLLILLPRFMGVDGIMYAQPITDLLSAGLSAVFLADEMRKMPKENRENEKTAQN